jgi:hypothetical protein
MVLLFPRTTQVLFPRYSRWLYYNIEPVLGVPAPGSTSVSHCAV